MTPTAALTPRIIFRIPSEALALECKRSHRKVRSREGFGQALRQVPLWCHCGEKLDRCTDRGTLSMNMAGENDPTKDWPTTSFGIARARTKPIHTAL